MKNLSIMSCWFMIVTSCIFGSEILFKKSVGTHVKPKCAEDCHNRLAIHPALLSWRKVCGAV